MESNFIEKLASQFGLSASVKNVFGEPIRVGEKTIIPVAQIGYGLGGGYGQQGKIDTTGGTGKAEQVSVPPDKDGNEGAGGGGGMYAKAKGVYEVTPSSTRFIPANNLTPLLVGICIGFILRGCRRAKLRK